MADKNLHLETENKELKQKIKTKHFKSEKFFILTPIYASIDDN